jgi:hypothetical protein
VRGLASAVLALEAIVVLLAVPVAVVVYGADATWAITGGVALIVLTVVAIGGLGRGWGYRVGWVVQGLAVALGFVVPAMFALGAIFGLLWYMALRLPAQAEAVRARTRPTGGGE